MIINSKVGNVNSPRDAWSAGSYGYGESCPVGGGYRDGEGRDGQQRGVCGWGRLHPSKMHHARYQRAATDRHEKTNRAVIRHGFFNLRNGREDFGGVTRAVCNECIPDLVVGIRNQIISGHNTYLGGATIKSRSE